MKISHFAVIKPKQDHIIKTSTRQVSLKVIPNTEFVSKEIHQPKATVAFEEQFQAYREEKSAYANKDTEEISHIIQQNSRRIRGFKVVCANGKIVNSKPSRIPVNAQVSKKEKEQVQLRVQAQARNSLEPVIKQRQSNQFMFSLEPYPNSNQAISPGIFPKNKLDTIPISQTKPITIQQQKERTIIESVVSHEQIKQINERGFIEIERSQQQIGEKEEKQGQVVSKEIKRYQIEQNYVDNHLNVQNTKSPNRSQHRHPIFTNQNAEYFEQSNFQPSSVHHKASGFKIDNKYTPIHDIESPKIHLNAYQQTYNGVQSKYEDRSLYLNNQNHTG